MINRAGIFIFICFMFCVDTRSIEAGKWTKWRDITLCDVMPCKCPGDRENRHCRPGIKYQLRACIAGSGGRLCQFDREGGPIRKVTCTNEGVCPGWSEYIATSECEEKWDSEEKGKGIRVETRYCNSPPPIHRSIKCVDSAGEEAIEVKKFTECEYVAPTTESTTAATTMSTTSLPCCTPGPTPEPWHSTTPGPESSSENYFDYHSLFCNPNCDDYGFDYDDEYQQNRTEHVFY